MYVTIIMKIGNMKKKQHEGLYGKAWRKERKAENDETTL